MKGGIVRSLLNVLLIIASDGHMDNRSSNGRICKPGCTIHHTNHHSIIPVGITRPTKTPFTLRKIMVSGGKNSLPAFDINECS